MKAKEVKTPQEPEVVYNCLVCGKEITAFYGTWGVTPMTQGGTCSRKCEDEQEKRSRFFFDGR